MILLSIGRRARGKTTLGCYVARRVSKRMIFDPRAMIAPAGDMSAHVTGLTSFKLAVTYLERRPGEPDAINEVVYAPNDADLTAAFGAFSDAAREWVERYPRRPLAILVDEIAFVSLQAAAFQWVLRCSDPSQTHVILTCHRPIDVPVGVRAIADYWCLFAMRQEHDLRVIEERCSPAVSQRVRRLKGREFILWDESVGVSTEYLDAHAWYVPLRGAPGAPGPRGDLLPGDGAATDDELTGGRLFD